MTPLPTAVEPATDDASLTGGGGSAWEVFLVFLKLGLTSFGGPIAHLGYFRDELVVRRRWVDEATYADLIALCQFLPGPASSQVGYALGLIRARSLGGLAAWCGFTLPSALLLLLVAMGASSLQGPIAIGLTHGLKLVAVAIVAQAVWSMARSLTPDWQRRAIAAVAVVVVAMFGGWIGQIAAILIGGLVGLRVCQSVIQTPVHSLSVPVSRRTGALALGTFAALFVALPLAAAISGSQGVAMFEAFYRSGALVFGGGHVMLPLLEESVVHPGWIRPDTFLAGYGAAQAVPGPLFTFAAYLGAAMQIGPNGILGAALCLVAIFMPGLLLVTGALPFWSAMRTRPLAQAAMKGTNAAVVGILAFALYDPLWTGTIHGPTDFALAAIGFGLLTVVKCPPWIVVLFMAASGVGLALI